MDFGVRPDREVLGNAASGHLTGGKELIWKKESVF